MTGCALPVCDVFEEMRGKDVNPEPSKEKPATKRVISIFRTGSSASQGGRICARCSEPFPSKFTGEMTIMPCIS